MKRGGGKRSKGYHLNMSLFGLTRVGSRRNVARGEEIQLKGPRAIRGCSVHRGPYEGTKLADYLTDVRKYDATADADVVAKIVKHLGIALRNNDSALVSCTDPQELDRVKKNWIGKKLGVADDAKASSVVEKVCETMSADRTKARVTFYYLTAKHLGKLGDL